MLELCTGPSVGLDYTSVLRNSYIANSSASFQLRRPRLLKTHSSVGGNVARIVTTRRFNKVGFRFLTFFEKRKVPSSRLRETWPTVTRMKQAFMSSGGFGPKRVYIGRASCADDFECGSSIFSSSET